MFGPSYKLIRENILYHIDKFISSNFDCPVNFLLLK